MDLLCHSLFQGICSLLNVMRLSFSFSLAVIDKTKKLQQNETIFEMSSTELTLARSDCCTPILNHFNRTNAGLLNGKSG